jgi:SAM-dependent methyltransferase
MTGPDIAFWQNKFNQAQTPWDRGAPNPQLAAWLASGEFAPTHGTVVVPGCGAGHEVEVLAASGCRVLAVDYAPAAVALTRARLGSKSLHADVIEADVLAWQPSEPVAAVYEQTCLCALHPDHWTAYAQQLRGWLRPAGRLLALFMQARRESAGQGWIEGPPYHCDIHAMRALFPADQWWWPKPPYPQVPHPAGLLELAVVLTRR